jgi:hypothetical protein
MAGELAQAPGAGALVLSGAEDFVDDGKPTTHFGLAVYVTADGKPSTVMIPDVTSVKDGKSPVYITRRIAINGKNLQKFLEAKQITLPDALRGTPAKGTGQRYKTKGSYNAEATEIEVSADEGSGTILAGDFVTFAGLDDAYEVETALDNATKKFKLKTPLGVPMSSGTAVSLGKPGVIADTEIACEAFYYTKAEAGPLLMMFTIQFQRGLIRSLTGDDALGNLFDIKGASIRVIKCNKESFETLKDYVAELTA